MKSTQIAPELHLITIARPKASGGATNATLKPTNQVVVLDRSGSMGWTIDKLCEDAKARVRSFKLGDTLTLGWFSGEGDFRFELIGYKLGSEADYSTVDKVLDRLKSTRNTTCFSGVLFDIEKIIATLSAISDRFALFFLTDGCPVVSNYQREIDSIYKAIDAIKGKIAASMLVGYGNYYNRELMTQMATRLGGTLVHSNNPEDVLVSMGQFINDSADAEPKISVSVPVQNPVAVFTVAGAQVNLYEPENGAVAVSMGKGEGTLYVLSQTPPKGADSADLTDKTALRGAYAAAWVLSQQAKSDVALEVLSTIGDVALVESMANAFTNDEFGAAEKRIARAATSEAKRFEGGKKVGVLPAYDAPCLLDALEILANDADAGFLPQHPDFHYNAISRKRTPKGDYPKFVPDGGTVVPFTSLVWNDDKLNLSVTAALPGTVELRGEFAKHNLPGVYKTKIMRNYTLVKDGAVNIVRPIPVVLGRVSFDALKGMGMLPAGAEYADASTVYLLDLAAVPVINRKIADGMKSAKPMFELAWRETVLQGKQKAFNALRKELDPEKKVTKSGLPAEVEAYLNTQGIKNGVYSPDMEDAPATDFYYADTFAIKVKGFSSFPKLEDVREKLGKSKPLTPVETLVSDGVVEFETEVGGAQVPVQIKWIDTQMAGIKDELAAIRSKLQRAKFALILAKRWPEEFKSRSENSLEIDGRLFTIELGKKKIEI